MTSPYKLKKDRFSSHRIAADYLISQAAQKNLHVLDLGCDVGFIGRLSDGANIEFTGADISDESLTKLPEMYTSKFRLNLNDKNWKIEKKFDDVILTDVLEHLINPAAALSQVRALLKPNGILILSVPNFAFIIVRLIILLGYFPQHSRGPFDKTHLYHYTRNSIKKLVKNTSFEIIDEKYTNPPIYLAAPHLFANPLGDAFYYLVHFLVKLMPELFAYQLVFFCKIKGSTDTI